MFSWFGGWVSSSPAKRLNVQQGIRNRPAQSVRSISGTQPESPSHRVTEGWLERLEREPEYELIIQAGEVGKRLRPRIPAPPATSSGGVSEEELRGMVPRFKRKTGLGGSSFKGTVFLVVLKGRQEEH